MAIYIVAKVLIHGNCGYRIYDTDNQSQKDIGVESVIKYISNGGKIENIDIASAPDKNNKLPCIEVNQGSKSIDGHGVIIFGRDPIYYQLYHYYDTHSEKEEVELASTIINKGCIAINATEVQLLQAYPYKADAYGYGTLIRTKAYLLKDEDYFDVCRGYKYKIKSNPQSVRILDKTLNKLRALGSTNIIGDDDGVFNVTVSESFPVAIIPDMASHVNVNVIGNNNEWHEYKIVTGKGTSELTINKKGSVEKVEKVVIDLRKSCLETLVDRAHIPSFFRRTSLEIYLNHGLEEISTNVFQSSSLEEIVIPNTVKRICRGAFDNSKKLKKVTFEEGSILEMIGYDAFRGTEAALLGIELPPSVRYIEPNSGSDISKEYNYTAYIVTSELIDTKAEMAELIKQGLKQL